MTRLLLLSFILLTSCVSVEDVLKPTITGYFVNGLVGVVVGGGLANLANQFNGVKHYAAISPLEYSLVVGPSIVSDIRRRAENGTLIGPLTLVGHSYGCGVIVGVSRQLKNYADEIRIDNLICLDGPKLPIPSNVIKADNIRPKIGRISLPMTRAKGNETTDIQEHSFGVGHVSLARHPRVLEIILERIGK